MTRMLTVAGVVGMLIALTGLAMAEDSKAATATRKKLQQKVTVNEKDVGLKAFMEDLMKNTVDKEIRYKIDNANGLSNNMKVSYSGKDVTVEKLLNDLSDKFDFGWYVYSDAANNKEDGKVVIRRIAKGKERGYEAGKEPK